MSTTNQLRVRRSILEIQKDYENGNKKPLEDLMHAWHGIKVLPHDDPNSFFVLGGFHGEPFRGKGVTDGSYWGGYCNHGNVLFPTWHRVYLLKLEEALQSIKGCEAVMLPYWDQTDTHSTTKGIPSCLTDEYFTFGDGTTISNPLRSFVFPVSINDAIEKKLYTKPAGYETVRYPLSGLVGTPEDKAATIAHNANYQFPDGKIDYSKTTPLLDGNVMGWLNGVKVSSGMIPPIGNGIVNKYHLCLTAPNYTVFSNTTSAGAWNKDPITKTIQVTPLESPHNEIHLSVGGCDVPGFDMSPISGANGDMGENETAGLDPVFFFHHCNVDRVFWIWQVKNGFMDDFEIIPNYAGTNNLDTGNGQQAPVGYEPNTPLTMESPLLPFTLTDNGTVRNYLSKDCINIEKQLGFTYESLSLDNIDFKNGKSKMIAENSPITAVIKNSNKVLLVSNINRANIQGSFVIMAYITINGVRSYLGNYAVLSRWKVGNCANCQTHLEVSATFSLEQFTEEELKGATYDVQISGRPVNEKHFAKFKNAAINETLPYSVEVI
jgi:tyrosinase